MSDPIDSTSLAFQDGAAPHNAPAGESRALAALETARDSARGYELASRSDATWRAYRSDWRIFETWCRSVGVDCLPATPDTLAAFLAAEADRGRAPSTLQRRIAAIRLVHIGAGMLPPHDAVQVTEVMRGIRRRTKRAPAKKAPAVDGELRAMVDALDPGRTSGLRDRALLLFGFAGALRRSEICAACVDDLERHRKGLLLRIPVSKGDQEGRGQSVALLARPASRFCPVAALDEWLGTAGISEGALFRKVSRGGKVGPDGLNPSSVADIVKKAASKAGLDASRYSAHSLRHGLLTSAAHLDGANVFRMRTHSRHKSIETVLGYVEDGDRFEHHAAEGLLDDDTPTIPAP